MVIELYIPELYETVSFWANFIKCGEKNEMTRNFIIDVTVVTAQTFMVIKLYIPELLVFGQTLFIDKSNYIGSGLILPCFIHTYLLKICISM